jgi:glycine/D-amino acid oxidase-like deaminating enzyme/nitrite reductase/ring-hydroxylating ferredoxin subunit
VQRSLPGTAASLWLRDGPATTYPPLDGDLSVDVAVIGGGLVGLTAATLLRRGGASVAVVEAGRIAHGVSGHTTAKVTALHDLRYSALERSWGEAAACAYAESNRVGVERVARLAAEQSIDCGLERVPAAVYAERAETVDAVEREAAAAHRAGLEVELTGALDLPFPVAVAVRLPDQVQLDPYRYVAGLARGIPGGGNHVLEGTRVAAVDEGEPCRVRTPHGSIVAGDVIVATLMPFLDRGAFFARVHPERSYLIAVRPERAWEVDGMYLSAEAPTRSLRAAGVEGERLLLVGGEGHKTGHDPRPSERLRHLERFAHERFGPVEVRYRWSAQDYGSVDGVPFVGRLTPLSTRVHVATGFGKWGMSAGTAAAEALSDAILKRRNLWSWLYDPSRLRARAGTRSFLAENLDVARRFAADRLVRGSDRPAEGLARGEGRVCRRGGRLVAASRDAVGRAHVVSAVCPHLGCVVAWNELEASWDCPCHGSRFAADGALLQGPAVEGLEREQP